MTTSLIQEQDSLEFKADFFPMTVIKFTTNNLEAIKSQVTTTVLAAPNYFKNAPVVIDISNVTEQETIDLKSICELLQEQSMVPVGIRGIQTGSEIKIPNGLATMKAPKNTEKKSQPSLTTGTAEKKQPEPKNEFPVTKLISTPIRSGTQHYARGGDLIITAAVNPGGECFADGNIHVYGPLRGKALAGANGNENARIFCVSLEAELIAIAGHYLTREQIQPPKNNKSMIQIYLKDGKIRIETV